MRELSLQPLLIKFYLLLSQDKASPRLQLQGPLNLNQHRSLTDVEIELLVIRNFHSNGLKIVIMVQNGCIRDCLGLRTRKPDLDVALEPLIDQFCPDLLKKTTLGNQQTHELVVFLMIAGHVHRHILNGPGLGRTSQGPDYLDLTFDSLRP